MKKFLSTPERGISFLRLTRNDIQKIFYLQGMISTRLIFLFTLLPVVVQAQKLTEDQQKAINNTITYVNHLTEQVNTIAPSLLRPYAQMLEQKRKPSQFISPYTCKTDARNYYYQESLKSLPALGTAGKALGVKTEILHKAYERIDSTCKALEIYYRLKDYQSDQFSAVEQFVKTLEGQVNAYARTVHEVQVEGYALMSKLQPYAASSPYQSADKIMRDQLATEKSLIDTWTLNILESVHTGWPVDKVQNHLREDEKLIPALTSITGIQYPASSMVKSFTEGVVSLQEIKRSGIDEYTYEKQQSDEHSNTVYNNLINYYNNVCISFYNTFISQAIPNGYRGIYYLKAVTRFSVQTTLKKINLDVQPFTDKPKIALTINPVATPVTPAVFNSLTNYTALINEGMRQINFMMSPVRNLNSSASYAVARLKSGSPVSVNYYNTSFELPVTLYQKTVDQTKVLPQTYQKALLDQAEVLYSILTELNQWNALLLAETASKQLAKDSLHRVYIFIERFKVLAETFDDKKEKLHQDVRAIFEAYKLADSKSPWVVSGKALLEVVDEDRKELFNAKKYFQGVASEPAQPERIQKLSRELIINEYKNLTGLQKLGRSNGLCPYSPYEDVAENSRQFAEAVVTKRERKSSGTSRHPYTDLIYQYNQNLVYQYNKFSELSKVPLMKSVYQLEWFEVIPPKNPEPMATAATVSVPASQAISPATTSPVSATKTTIDAKRDTIYISRIDTVYVGMPGENLRSMEGYATNHLVLLLDVSGSMNSEEKLPILKKSLSGLMEMMRPEDKITIVTYSGKAKVVLLPTSFKEAAKINAVIDKLVPEGKTDGNAGIKLAYKVADENYIRGGNNRIILATDGEFPMGKPTYELAKKFAEEDIFITVFNFGKSTASSKNLQQLASMGRGNYEYISQANIDLKLITEVKAKHSK